MKVCFYLTQDISDWSISSRKDGPILPIPGSLTKDLSKKNKICFLIKKGTNKKYPIDNEKFFDSFELMLKKVDIFISIGSAHIKLLKENFSIKNKRLLKRKAFPIIYRKINKIFSEISIKNNLLLYFSRGQIYTSRTQYDFAKLNKVGNPIFLPIGIDLDFYSKSRFSSNFLESIIDKKYIVMHGDEERDEEKLIKIADSLNFGIVRINQYPQKAKKNIFDIVKISSKIPFIYNFQNIGFDKYIWLLKNASLYAGMVNSKWQPAGWTALCEALGLGIPSIISKGLTSNDYEITFSKNIKNKFNLLITENINKEQNKIKNLLENNNINRITKDDLKPSLLNINIASKIFHNNLIKAINI